LKADNNSRNLIHASDSFDSASKEIELWFAQAELAEYKVSFEILSKYLRVELIVLADYMGQLEYAHRGSEA
jgi:hypothetical protein